MKKYIRLFLLAIAMMFTALPEKASAESVRLDADWSKFMTQHDPVWERLPENYFEGAFVGNGLLGTIVFRDSIQTNSLCFEIGRTDIYDHRTGAPAHQEGSRLPIGQALLTPFGKITSAKLRTDLWNAEIRGEITTDAGEIKWRCFVPSDGEIIVLELTGMGAQPPRGALVRHLGRSPPTHPPSAPRTPSASSRRRVPAAPRRAASEWIHRLRCG